MQLSTQLVDNSKTAFIGTDSIKSPHNFPPRFYSWWSCHNIQPAESRPNQLNRYYKLVNNCAPFHMHVYMFFDIHMSPHSLQYTRLVCFDSVSVILNRFLTDLPAATLNRKKKPNQKQCVENCFLRNIFTSSIFWMQVSGNWSCLIVGWLTYKKKHLNL